MTYYNVAFSVASIPIIIGTVIYIVNKSELNQCISVKPAISAFLFFSCIKINLLDIYNLYYNHSFVTDVSYLTTTFPRVCAKV